MQFAEIAVPVVGFVVAAGAYLRWAVRPVAGAYRLGREVGRRWK